MYQECDDYLCPCVEHKPAPLPVYGPKKPLTGSAKILSDALRRDVEDRLSRQLNDTHEFLKGVTL